MHTIRYTALVGIAFLLGIISASYLPEMPGLWWSGLLLIILPVIWFFRRYRWVQSVAVFISGGLWLIVYVHLFAPVDLPTLIDSQTITVTGEIVAIPRNNTQRSRFDFFINEIHDVDTKWHGKVRLSWYHPDVHLRAGQHWRLKIKLKPAHGFANPGGFDYERSLYRQGIAATGYVREAKSAILISQSTTLHSIRQFLSNNLRQAMPTAQHAGLLIALTTGDKQYIDPQQWQVLTRTGTIHLMAISGLHIGLIFGLFFWLGSFTWRMSARLCLFRPAQDVAIVTGLIAAIIYAAMAGFSIPTQRALIMLAVIAISLLSRRLTAPLDVLQAALLMVLMLDPLAILSAGFWLSFAAVAVILLTLDRADDASETPAWYRLIKIQWVIALGLLPLTSLFFYQVSVVAPVMNLLAVPWVGLLVVPLSLMGAVLSVISPSMAEWVLSLADSLMQILWWLLTQASDSPYAVVHPANPAPWILLLTLSGLALVLFHPATRYRVVGLCLFAPLFLPATSSLEEPGFQVDFLDVGQGLAVVVRTAEHTLLYDAGFSNDTGFDIGQRVVLPYLWHQGVTVLNRVVLSHDDRDHVGGYASVSREIPVRQLTVMPGSKYLADSSVTACQAGESWSWDGVDFRFLHPQVNAGGQENNRSCVLKISGRGGGSVLLTGDIEKSAEKNLILHAHNQLQADVLLAPHHGSKTSSTREFIASVKAKEVVYSAGYRNRFGFPKPEVMARYTRASVRQWNTADSGMLRYRFDGMKDRYQRWVYRQENRRFWQSGAVE